VQAPDGGSVAHPTADGNLGVTLATFLFLVRRSGIALQDPTIEAACAAFDTGGATVEALGTALVAAVRARVGGDRFEDVVAALRGLLGADRVRTDLGDAPDREGRAANIRRAHFGQRLPWLAVIIDRTPDGDVGRHWVMVESFDEVVRAMDPNPWDDRDEERVLPVGDFMVQWELAGCPSIRIG
jgi:hypothetical protein